MNLTPHYYGDAVVWIDETGLWVGGLGPSFPVHPEPTFAPPNGATFWRTDLHQRAHFHNGAWLLESAIYNPTSLTTVAGTFEVGKTVADLAVRGSVLHWDELDSTPGFDVIFDFTDVPEPPQHVYVTAYYNGNHHPVAMVWNYVMGAWDAFNTYDDGTGLLSNTFPVDSRYWSAGAMRVRLYHSQNGSSTHDLYVDFIGAR